MESKEVLQRLALGLIDGLINEASLESDFRESICSVYNVLDYVNSEKYDYLCDGECNGQCKEKILNALNELKMKIKN